MKTRFGLNAESLIGTIRLVKQKQTAPIEENPTEAYDVRFGNPVHLSVLCVVLDSSMWYEDCAQLWGDSYKDSLGKVKLIKIPKGKYEPEQIYTIGMKDYWVQMDNNIDPNT